MPVNARNRVEWVRGEQQFLPGLARRAGVSLLHSLASTAPGRGRYRRVVTVHDLNYRTVPEAHLGLLGLGMRVLVPLAARTAHRVIADSWSTRADLVRLLGLRAAKVDVVHPGFGVSPAPALGAAETRSRFSLPADRPLLLCLSAMRPHKNLAGLLRALALLDPRPVTVLAGYETPHVAELRELAGELGVAADVRFPGWISSSEVEGLFALASAFAFPSLYEGFGLPVIEALARGVPTASSDRASLPEVAGDAALMFDPADPPSIAAALRAVLFDEPLRARLREAGPRQAATFTWDRAARETVAVYERA